MMNVNEMIEKSFEKNREFKRKPQKLLKKSAQNALTVYSAEQILSSADNDQDTAKDIDDDDDDDDEDRDEEETLAAHGLESMNSSLLRLYSSSTATAQSQKAVVIDQQSTAAALGTDSAVLLAAAETDSTAASKSLKRKSKESGTTSKKPKVSLNEKWPTPTSRLSDLGGMDEIVQELLQLIGMPLLHPEIFQHLGIDPPRGILLQGAPGCGKTLLAHAIAGESGVPFISIAAPTIVSGMSGESEKKIREVFDEAKELAPCILFIDEIDAITPKRETAQREMERRIVAQLLTCMDDVSFENTGGKAVIVIGATNRPDSLDPALRRAGRFDREISLPVPDQAAREKILAKMAGKLAIDGQVSFEALAKLTPGFLGADLKGLMGEAGMIAVKRIFSSLAATGSFNQNDDADEDEDDEMAVDEKDTITTLTTTTTSSSSGVQEPTPLSFSSLLKAMPPTLSPSDLAPLSIKYQDFVDAVKKVQPSSKREGFATVPGVSWEDIGALERVRQELRMAVVEPIRHPEYFKAVGLSSSMGVLLFGPPGCGKTLLAKAVANESHCNFLSVKGPELINKYVGESERAIRQVFSRAQASSPCVIFFDEIDAICPARSNDAESQSSSRLVNTLLTEMDGMQGRKLVFVIAATNRPDMIDPAMLRPGRLDKSLYVDLPNEEERLSILTTLTRGTPLDAGVDLRAVAGDKRTNGMSGADLASLVREASVNRVRDVFYSSTTSDRMNEQQMQVPEEGILVTNQDFEQALAAINPSVGDKDRRKYELLRVKFAASSC